MKKVLILAYYFPPLGMGGTQRAAKFVKYLPEFGWQPTVITVKDVAYYAYDQTLLSEVSCAEILRTGSLDPQRLLFLLKGQPEPGNPQRGAGEKLIKLLSYFYLPDLKLLWLPFACLRSIRLLRRQKFDLIFSTSPPHSIHLLAALLTKLFHVPWVADFRDGWAGGNFQEEPTIFHHRLNAFLQAWVCRNATYVTTVSSPLAGSLAGLTNCPKGKFFTITNGFDSDDFDRIKPVVRQGEFNIVYSGALSAISPVTPFLQGLAKLLTKEKDLRKEIRVTFVGANLQADLLNKIHELRLGEVVRFSGYLEHKSALESILSADLLLYPIACQAGQDFIPGKTFEYLASGREILALGPEVAGMKILKTYRRVTPVGLNDINGIAQAIKQFWQKRKDAKPDWDTGKVAKFERRELTKNLAQLFDECITSLPQSS